MGNVFDYAEVIVETCTGDTNTLKFDEGPAFRDNRMMANQALAILSRAAMGGKDMSHYRGVSDTDGWYQKFPSWSHITGIRLYKTNPVSDARKPVVERTYTCEHTRTAG